MWLWFKERMPNGLVIAIVVAPLTALGYGLSYIYYYGFFEVYRIPTDFIDIDLMKLTETILLLVGLIALTILFMLTPGYGYWLNKFHEMLIKFERWKIRRSVNPEQHLIQNQVGELAEEQVGGHDEQDIEQINENDRISFYIFINKLTDKIIYYGRMVTLIFTGFLLLTITPNIDILTLGGIILFSVGLLLLLKHFNRIKTIILYVLSVLFLISYLLGISNAINKHEYMVITNNSDTYVVLNSYKDKLIVAPFKEDKIFPVFKIIETGEKIDDYDLILTETGVLDTLQFKDSKSINKLEIIQIKEYLHNVIGKNF